MLQSSKAHNSEFPTYSGSWDALHLSVNVAVNKCSCVFGFTFGVLNLMLCFWFCCCVSNCICHFILKFWFNVLFSDLPLCFPVWYALHFRAIVYCCTIRLTVCEHLTSQIHMWTSYSRTGPPFSLIMTSTLLGEGFPQDFEEWLWGNVWAPEL